MVLIIFYLFYFSSFPFFAKVRKNESKNLTRLFQVFFELFLMDKEGNYLNNYDIATYARVQQQSLDLQVGNFDVRFPLGRMLPAQSLGKFTKTKERNNFRT